ARAQSLQLAGDEHLKNAMTRDLESFEPWHYPQNPPLRTVRQQIYRAVRPRADVANPLVQLREQHLHFLRAALVEAHPMHGSSRQRRNQQMTLPRGEQLSVVQRHPGRRDGWCPDE